MIKGLILILLVGLPALHFTELGSDSAFRSVVLPVICLFSVIALALWFVTLFHRLNVAQTSNSSNGGGVGGVGGGDFGGGGDGGC